MTHFPRFNSHPVLDSVRARREASTRVVSRLHAWDGPRLARLVAGNRALDTVSAMIAGYSIN